LVVLKIQWKIAMIEGRVLWLDLQIIGGRKYLLSAKITIQNAIWVVKYVGWVGFHLE
jgi:hypothetical protein